MAKKISPGNEACQNNLQVLFDIAMRTNSTASIYGGNVFHSQELRERSPLCSWPGNRGDDHFFQDSPTAAVRATYSFWIHTLTILQTWVR
ncbi:MAG: hypothetical protein DSZ23_00240, partial [Thermodesulfatator sp.]